MLPVEVEYGPYELDGESIPSLSASASRADDGRVHLSLCHPDPDGGKRVTVEFTGMTPASIRGRILTAREINAHNMFDASERVKPGF